MAPVMSMLRPQCCSRLAWNKDLQQQSHQCRATACSQAARSPFQPSQQQSIAVAAHSISSRVGDHAMASATNTRRKRLAALRAVAQATETIADQADEDDSSSPQDGDTTTALGPAFQATLRMLEWPRICEHLAEFASTAAGKRACQRLLPPATTRESEQELALTRAATVLEYDYATTLDFGGINTTDGARALARADKGGVCSPAQLRAAVSIMTGAEKIKKQIQVAGRENDALGRGSPIAPLLSAASRIAPQPLLVREISSAIDEENNILDAASETLRTCRQRVKLLQSRLTSLLKGYGGEVSERGGRLCVALPAGAKMPAASMLLGSSQGGGVVYVEPPAAVPANNELAAARGEAFSAEEAVLYSLTGKLMGVLPQVQEMYELVVWFDTLSAKARYGLWLDGTLPRFVPWAQVFHARGASAARKRAKAGSDGLNDSTNEREDGSDDDDQGDNDADSSGEGQGVARYAVRLRGLRHPLLYGDFLRERQRLEREFRRAGGTPALLQSMAAAEGSSIKDLTRPSGRASGLSQRREEMLRESGLMTDSMDAAPTPTPQSPRSNNSKGGHSKGPSPQAVELARAILSLKPPVPLDLSIKPHTSVVVITGPNTGGKTATMKALGLAAVMARCGLPLPCDAPALLPAFSAVLADIGDEQSLTANLSTFSGHLRRIQALRGEADGRALVLLDELGTGTDPMEGAALGVALLKRMVAGGPGAGALTIATTHHSLMTSLKFDDPQGRFENASVEFDEVALAPTYRLLWGIPGRSNALNIAARLGLDPAVVEAARSRLDTSVSAADAAIQELEALREQLQGEEAASWAVEQEVESLRQGVARLRERVSALQRELQTASSEALFEIWLAARQRLAALRERKRARGVTTPSSSSPTSPPSATTPPDTSDKETVVKALNELASSISAAVSGQDIPLRTHTAPAQPSSSSATGSKAGPSSGNTLLDDLSEEFMEVEDLVEEQATRLRASEAARQQAKAQAKDVDRQFVDAVVGFEALAAQLPAPDAPPTSSHDGGSRSQQEEEEEGVAREAAEEYDALVSQFEELYDRARAQAQAAKQQQQQQHQRQAAPGEGRDSSSRPGPARQEAESEDPLELLIREIEEVGDLMVPGAAAGKQQHQQRSSVRNAKQGGSSKGAGPARGTASSSSGPSHVVGSGRGLSGITSSTSAGDDLDDLIAALEEMPRPAPSAPASAANTANNRSNGRSRGSSSSSSSSNSPAGTSGRTQKGAAAGQARGHQANGTNQSGRRQPHQQQQQQVSSGKKQGQR